MRYYISQAHFIQPRNRVQRQIQQFVESPGNMTVNSDGDLEHLIAWIEKEVETANSLYPGCTPMEVKVYDYKSCDSVGIYIGIHNTEFSTVSLSAYRVYAVYETQPGFSRGLIQKEIL